MRSPRLAAVAISLLLAIFLTNATTGRAVAQQPAGPVAVIAHGTVPVNDLTFGELRRIFLGDRQFWSSSLRIALLVPAWQGGERRALLQKIYEKDEAHYRHYWIAKVFTTEAATAPKGAASPALAVQLVREIRGSVTLIDAELVPPGVKVLTIDGKRPGESGYPLQ